MLQKVKTKAKDLIKDSNKRKQAILALATIAGSFVTVHVAIPDSPDNSSFQQQEIQRSIAIDNSLFNAKKYRQDHIRLTGTTAIAKVDDEITKKCVNGDGWAGVNLHNSKGDNLITLVCSTVSSTLGCYDYNSFLKSNFVNQDGTCNTDIPLPLERLTN